MGIDHSNPYIHSTTVLCDIYTCIYIHAVLRYAYIYYRVGKVPDNTYTIILLYMYFAWANQWHHQLQFTQRRAQYSTARDNSRSSYTG